MPSLLPILIVAAIACLAILLLATVAAAAMRKRSAAARHMMWPTVVLAVLAVPLACEQVNPEEAGAPARAASHTAPEASLRFVGVQPGGTDLLLDRHGREAGSCASAPACPRMTLARSRATSSSNGRRTRRSSSRRCMAAMSSCQAMPAAARSTRCSAMTVSTAW